MTSSAVLCFSLPFAVREIDVRSEVRRELKSNVFIVHKACRLPGVLSSCNITLVLKAHSRSICHHPNNTTIQSKGLINKQKPDHLVEKSNDNSQPCIYTSHFRPSSSFSRPSQHPHAAQQSILKPDNTMATAQEYVPFCLFCFTSPLVIRIARSQSNKAQTVLQPKLRQDRFVLQILVWQWLLYKGG